MIDTPQMISLDSTPIAYSDLIKHDIIVLTRSG